MNNKQHNRAILLFSCSDLRGIVAEVSHFILTYEGNIIDSDQHRDPEAKAFFMRVEFDISNFRIPVDKIRQAFEPIALKYDMNWHIEFPEIPQKVAIFVSKYDHCLYDIILRNKAGEIQADIAMIVSNHEDLKPIAEYFKIPFYYIPVPRENKQNAEQSQLALLKEQGIELIVLARYMQIIPPDFVAAYPNKIINIHHSFLPAFIGAKPYHQAYKRGVKIIGATSHYVTSELDQGPIIEQNVARITHKDNVEHLVIKGRNLERDVLSRAVRLHLEHRILTYDNKTVVFD